MDQNGEGKREKAVAYKQMMDTWAWKDLQLFLDSERQSALELAIVSEEMKDVQINRGKVKAFDSIQSHVGYSLNEHN